MELYLFAPNPGLKPENMMDYEASYEQVLMEGRLSAEMTLYFITGSNLIEIGSKPVAATAGDPLQFRVVQAQRS